MPFSPNKPPGDGEVQHDAHNALGNHLPSWRERFVFSQYCSLHGFDYVEWIEIYANIISLETDEDGRNRLIKHELQDCKRQNTAAYAKGGYHLLAGAAAVLAIVSFLKLM